jgi:hypothetical protein
VGSSCCWGYEGVRGLAATWCELEQVRSSWN